MRQYTLITGASSGIGQQCAIQLSKDYNLILCARDIGKLNQTLEKCCNNNNHIIFSCDLNNIVEIGPSLSKIINSNEITINKFLHCAGVTSIMGAKSFDYNTIKELMNVNLYSAMEIVKNLIRKNPNQKALINIIFISALYSKKGVKGNSFYAASKGALDSYMRSIALELAPDVRVNSILPGGIRTSMSEIVYGDENAIEQLKKGYPLGMGQTEDIANMAEFLFSDKAKWITGQQISVDGGATI